MSETPANSRHRLKWLLPPLVLVGAVGVAGLMVALKPEIQLQEHVPVYPVVEVFTVQLEPVRLSVASQGSVRPLQQTRLTARVSGPIEWISPAFYAGGAFQEGEVLLRLDPLPYESALAEARSRLALAEAAWLQEQEAAEQARRDWERLGAGAPNPLALRQPQLDKAAADREAALAAVAMAARNLEHTRIRAPYDGRVEAKHVDVGQAIAAQATVLADIFATAALEVPLPITLDELAFLDPAAEPPVRLSAEVAGLRHEWRARLVRVAATVDPRSRLVTVFARVEPPYTSNHGMELKPGLFVRAEIEGRTLPEAARIPRAALQPGGHVYLLDHDNRLRLARPELARTDTDWAIARAGLRPGDRICLTPLLSFAEGMRVEPVPGGEPSGAHAP